MNNSNMKIYFKIFKLIVIIADIFIAGVLSIVLVSTYFVEDGFITVLMLTAFSVLFFSLLEIFLVKYYQNIVISVDFTGDCVIINTNKKQYVLPKKYIKCVKEDTSSARTYIFYNDGVKEKKFVYIMRYAFKTHYLDICEMKKQLPYTNFE